MFDTTPQTITFHDTTLTYARIPWDSRYLGNTTVEIKTFAFATIEKAKHLLSSMSTKLGLQRGDLVFYKHSPLDVVTLRMLTSLGFYPVEEAVEISFDLTHWNPKAFPQSTNRQYRLIPATTIHLPSMKKIAEKAFTRDRYHTDPNIPDANANKRFMGWLITSMERSSDEVYAFVDTKDNVAGFFIIAKKPEGVNLRLAAIDPALVGKGLGKQLYFSMFSILKERHESMIHTQISLNNTAVFNVYTYLVHPRITRLEAVLHYML